MAEQELARLYASIPARYPELRGQVAIVTGSTKGIGKGIALRLAREGMRMVVNSRTPADMETTTAELRSLGADVIGVAADHGISADVDRLFGETLKAFGTVDVLVNNAADLSRSTFFEVDEAWLDRELSANVRGPFLCARHAARIMREKRSGSIIHISSVGGLRAQWSGLPYGITKGALDAMTRVMAIDLAQYGIRVNCVAPGATYTEAWGPIDSPWIKDVAQRIPLGRLGTPLEMGAAVAFLASPDASYIVGHVMYVDAGITVQLSPRGQDI
jgi:NAD(P)-dependent dehydrogenase (short-subunit alcohol dehydrogenase family)